jgi:hypothetical protein
LCEKAKHYPRCRVGDIVKLPEKDYDSYREGKIVGVFQSAEDPSKFHYTVRWCNGVVEPVDDIDELEIDKIIETLTYMLNGHIDELRSLFPSKLPDNLDLKELFEEFNTISKGMEEYLRHYKELCWIQDLRNEVLGL